MFFQRHKKTGICCCFSLRTGSKRTFSKFPCEFRFAALFEIATDSWKSRTLSVLILLTAFLGPLNILLQSLGFAPLTASDRPVRGGPITDSPIELPPDVERVFASLFQAIWVMYTAVVALPLLSGNSSHQNNAMTMITTFMAGAIAGTNMYTVLTDNSPDSVKIAFYMLFSSPEDDVWPYYISAAVQGVAYTALSVVMFLFFVAQTVTSLRWHYDYDYDQKRLEQYYDLVQRLVTPTRLLMKRAVLNDGSFSNNSAVSPQKRPHSLWRYMRRTFLFKSHIPTDDEAQGGAAQSQFASIPEKLPLLMSPPSSRDRMSFRTPRNRLRSSKSGSAIATPIRHQVWSHEDYAALDDDVVDLNDAFKEEDVNLMDEEDDGTFWSKVRFGVSDFFVRLKNHIISQFDSMRHSFILWMEKKPEPPPVHSLYEQDKDFFFPSRVLMTCATSIVVVSIVAFVVTSKAYTAYKTAYADYPEGTRKAEEDGLFWSLVGSAVISFTVTILSWTAMLNSYRKLVLALRRGQDPIDKSRYSIFFSSAYIGYQIAHSVLGFVVIMVLCKLLFAGVSALVVSESARQTTVQFLKTTFLTWFIRQVLSWTIFPWVFTTWNGRYIRFPFVFQFVEFILMFLDALSGIVSSISRLVVGATIVLLNIGRLDVPIYPQEYHNIDGAYAAFISTALLDHYTNNPIKLVFIDMLWKSVKPTHASDSVLQIDQDTERERIQEERRRRARNKWRLVVLLVRNPSVVQYRKHNLRKKAAEEWRKVSAQMANS